MFAPPPADPRWSVAIIRDNDDKSAGPYNVGSKLREATSTTSPRDACTWTSATAGASTWTCSTGRSRAPAPVAAAPAAPTDPFAAELDKGIKKIGEHNYEVQRSTLDSLLGNMGALAKGARIVPETKRRQVGGLPPVQHSSRRSVCEDRPVRTVTSSRPSTASR